MAITYSISGGADAAKFTIDGATGKLVFKTAPDFEAPGDANKDNVYELTVKVTGSSGKTATKDMRVSCTDVLIMTATSSPQITSAAAVSVPENVTEVTTVLAVELEGDSTAPPITPPSGADAPTISNVRTASSVTSYWNVAKGGTTRSNHLVAYGTAVASAQIKVSLGGTLKGTATANAGGSWSYDLGLLTDGAQALTATATVGGVESNPSSTFNFTIAANVTSFPGPTGNIGMNDKTYYNLGSGRSYGVANPDTHTLRTEVHTGDGTWNQPAINEMLLEEHPHGAWGTVEHVTFEVMIEPGKPNSAPHYVILVETVTKPPGPSQGPNFHFGMPGRQDKFDALVAYDNPNHWEKIVWTDTSNFVRGTWYNVELEIKLGLDGSGYAKVWLNGKQVVNYAGLIGTVGGEQTHWNFGLYRDNTPEVLAVHFRNYLSGS